MLEDSKTVKFLKFGSIVKKLLNNVELLNQISKT